MVAAIIILFFIIPVGTMILGAFILFMDDIYNKIKKRYGKNRV